jgi:hypothetical protein
VVKGTDQMEIPVTNNASVAAFMTLLKARGTALQEDDPVTIRHTSTASVTKYDQRRYTLPAEFIPNTGEAQDYCRYVASQLDEPFPVLTSVFKANESQASIDEVLVRDVSDRISVSAQGASGLGINEDFFVERIRVSVDARDVITYRAELSPATVLGIIIVLDTGPGLDTGVLGY